jgi:hypothetical protein
MSQDSSGWTITTLKEHYDVRLAAQGKAVDAALAAAKEAVTKAEAASEKRFESINEFRGTLADQQRTLMPRAEAEKDAEAFRTGLAAANARLDRMEGQGTGKRDVWAYIVGAVGVALAIWQAAQR